MRVLIDMNLSPAWEQFLVANGLEARHWVNVGDPRASDEELLAWARREGFIVFTHDLDFSVILARTAASGPSVIQLRSQRVLPDDLGAEVLDALLRTADALLTGAIVTIDDHAARVRVLPIPRR